MFYIVPLTVIHSKSAAQQSNNHKLKNLHQTQLLFIAHVKGNPRQKLCSSSSHGIKLQNQEVINSKLLSAI